MEMFHQIRESSRTHKQRNRGQEMRWRSRPLKHGQAGSIGVGGNIAISTDTTIDIVLDYSVSMHDILPAVYIFCQDMLAACQMGNARVKFGITYFSDEVWKKTWSGKNFTNYPSDVLSAMQEGMVGGGSKKGGEQIGQAIRFSLKKLKEEEENKEVPAGERVLVLFTDAVPQDDTDFRGETAVRSAVLFVPAENSGQEYLFRMVDAQGRPMRSKTPYIFNMKDVVEGSYLKKEEDPEDKLPLLRDNENMRNQLLWALS